MKGDVGMSVSILMSLFSGEQYFSVEDYEVFGLSR